MKAKQEFNTDGKAVVKPFLRRSKDVFGYRRLLIVIVVVLASLLAASCKKTPKEGENEVAAQVGSREITVKQVDRGVRARINPNAMGNVAFTPAELANARLVVLDELIRNEALYLRAEKEGGLVPDDSRVTQELQKAKQGLSEEDYKQQLQLQQTTEEEMRDDLRKALAINALLEREKAKVKEPREEEIKKYYEDNKAAFVSQRGADVSVIAVSPDNNGGAAGAEQKIQNIHAQLRAGSDFATVASQNSEEQTSALRGGRLGFGPEAGIQQAFPGVPNLGSRLMSMTEGQYTEPIKDNLSGAWYIFKLNFKREQPQDLTYEQAKQEIIQVITSQRQQVLLESLVRVAIAEAGVKNYFAERLVSNPEGIAAMRPSGLLQTNTQSAQPSQPRFENQNQASPQTNANSSATSTNTSRPQTNSAGRAPASNTNR